MNVQQFYIAYYPDDYLDEDLWTVMVTNLHTCQTATLTCNRESVVESVHKLEKILGHR